MRGIIAWELPQSERARLLGMFPPRYPDVIAHHITHVFNGRDTDPLPEQRSCTVIGVADNDEGVQALIVDMGMPRPDGEIYHITWSLDRAKGFAPKDSKAVAKRGFVPTTPIIIEVEAKFFMHGSM